MRYDLLILLERSVHLMRERERRDLTVLCRSSRISVSQYFFTREAHKRRTAILFSCDICTCIACVVVNSV